MLGGTDMRSIFLALLVSLLITGCSSGFTEWRADSNGHVTKVGTFTGDEYWKHLVDERISAELAGQKPEGGSRDWEDFWRVWYADIRLEKKPAWKSSEFKTSEDMVTYIKQQRVAKGLPTYD
jgi:hypothetical protein